MDNKKKILYFEIGSLVFCLIFSSFNHFLFELSGESLLFAPFVPINESVWEHGKLLFVPFLFYALFEFAFLKDNKNFLFAKSLPLVLSIPLMIVGFYTYSGVIGTHNTIIDIILAISIVVFTNVLSYKILISEKTYKCLPLTVAVFLILFLIVLFTFIQPRIHLFLDTTNQTYGL